jgi:Na+(H+)/acetate symporter ActP
VYGALGRLYAPDSVVRASDVLVLELPRLMVPGLGGELLTGMVTAGAFAAFLSTSSGLTIAVAGVLSQDVASRRLSGITAFRVAGVAAVVVPCAVAIAAPDVGVARTVGLAFAVAASTFCPLLVLGIWWRPLSSTGAAAGLLVGGGLATAAVSATLSGVDRDGWTGALLAQPAAWTVPIAFAVMVAVSLRTPHRVAPNVGHTMVRLHAPEAIFVTADRSAAGDGRSSQPSDR